MSNTEEKDRRDELNELQLKADIVLLVDLISAQSSQIQLSEHEALKAEFLEKAAQAKPVSIQEIKEAINEPVESLIGKQEAGEADDSPRAKARIKKLSRRALLTHLFEDELKEDKAEPDQAEPFEPRKLEPEYFDKVLAACMAANHNVAQIDSWDGKRFYHYLPLMSASYAKLLCTKNNPYQLVLDAIRDNSRIYPRPIGVYCFEYPPFNLDKDTIKGILDRIAADENAKDIKVSVTEQDSVYLYSSDYLEDDYADFLAEEMDRGIGEGL